MSLASGYVDVHHGPSPNLKVHKFSLMEAQPRHQCEPQDTCDQDKSANSVKPCTVGFSVTGFLDWEDVDVGRQHVILLPGAWAMGDGLILDEEAYPGPAGTSSSTASSSRTTSPWNVESFSSQVVRLAGSFRTSVGGYIADLTTALTSDTHTEDSNTPEHTTFVEGDIVWMPRAHAHTVAADKKQK